MLRKAKELRGDPLRALDGDIGKVDEILFDDEGWTVRYLVVDTGSWLGAKTVLIAPPALGALDPDRQVINVNLTKDQVERSPAADTNEPVSRQWEAQYYDYYSWPYYWGGMGVAGSVGLSDGLGLYPGALVAPAAGDFRKSQYAADERASDHRSVRDHGDVHLRSTREITGYAVVARDGRVGHVEDFLFDDENWRVCYLAVNTHEGWPGKKVLVPRSWIGQLVWPDRIISVDVTRDQVRNGPEWDTYEPISSEYEDDLSDYCALQDVVSPDNHLSQPDHFLGKEKISC